MARGIITHGVDSASSCGPWSGWKAIPRSRLWYAASSRIWSARRIGFDGGRRDHGFVQKGIAGDLDKRAILEMGNRRRRHADARHRTSVRGFGKSIASCSMSDSVVAARAIEVPLAAKAAIARLMAQRACNRQRRARALAAVLYRPRHVSDHSAHGLRAGHRSGSGIATTATCWKTARSLREINVYEPHVYRHIIGPTKLNSPAASIARKRATVVRTMHDGEMTAVSAGRYVDEIVLEKDAALLKNASSLPIGALRYPGRHSNLRFRCQNPPRPKHKNLHSISKRP